MPQMAPISWLTLFLSFFLIFIMFNIMNYFIYSPSSPTCQKKSEIFTKPMNWKW
uniref:ATP synthase complex subunit 8 n=1 Tax=Liriomyza huidobrensis TaxID=127405 RepID=R4HIC4_LIRHU|nr:ATP8 gene product [Liriomyza huidobrensis]AEO51713.1 ATP synthase F0 subunit 8 [Liriomyza huidobrensis]AFL93375.1 ATP synthase F0 subunit 8 [Liriomyza huidobrensis]